jgi:hypothetical protein
MRPLGIQYHQPVVIINGSSRCPPRHCLLLVLALICDREPTDCNEVPMLMLRNISPSIRRVIFALALLFATAAPPADTIPAHAKGGKQAGTNRDHCAQVEHAGDRA